MKLPKLLKVKQNFSSTKIGDLKSHLITELELSFPKVKSNSKIAITVGSRGFNNRVEIVKSLVKYLKDNDAKPFLIGAMGSHGGGTAEGQMDVLESLGYTEESIGCPILTSDETVEIGRTQNNFKVFCDKYAWESDGIIVVNRIKVHTAFHGLNESGLLKMISVGLGKSEGANQFHRQDPEHMAEVVREVGEFFINTKKVIAGVGIVENSFDETAHLKVIKPENFVKREQELLMKAKEYFPRLPVDNLDILIIGMMGKNYSGTGIDTNVIGRMKISGVPEPNNPSIKRVVILDLHPSSHGNATGIGLADITTNALFKKIDRQKTYHNCITSTYVQRAMIPMIFDTEYKAIEAAIESLAIEDEINQLRIAVIKNTQDLESLYITENLLEESEIKLTTLSDPETLTFDKENKLKQIYSLKGR